MAITRKEIMLSRKRWCIFKKLNPEKIEGNQKALINKTNELKPNKSYSQDTTYFLKA